MGCVEISMRGTLFIVKFLEAEKPHIIIELKLPGSRKVVTKQKASREMKIPWIVANTTDRL